MNKFLIYTSNLDIMPKDMEDVLEFAKSQPKFRISNVELNGCLANVEAGDNSRFRPVSRESHKVNM